MSDVDTSTSSSGGQGGSGDTSIGGTPVDVDSEQTLEQAISAAKAKATPASSSDETAASGDEGTTQAQPQQASPVDGDSAPTPDQLRLLTRWRLPAPRAGETREQVWDRLDRHDKGRYNDHKRERQELTHKLNNLQSLVEPMARSYIEQQQRAQREAAMAAMPDPEVDPVGYNRVLAEETLRKLNDRDEYERRQQAEQQQLSQILDIDDENVAELEYALTDENVSKAYSFVTQIGYRNAQRMFPDADDNAIMEFVQNAQILDMRNHRARGLNIAESINQTARDAWELASQLYGTPAANAMAAAAQPVQANGNGHAPAAPVAPPRPAAGSPTADRLTREHAQANARRAVSAPGARASGPAGEGIDLRQITDPEQLLKLLMSGQVSDEMIQAQLGKVGR